MEMLERDGYLEELEGHLSAARCGEGRLVWVQGEAGVGKTALVRRFCEQVRGARVVVGACDPLSTPRPLGPVVELVDRFDLDGAPGTRAPSREALVRRFFEELASPSWVTVAVIEDAQWADEATLDVLQYVGRRLGDLRALVAVTFRDDEAGDAEGLRRVVGDLGTAQGVARLELSPLSRAGVGTLVDGVESQGELDADALYELTGGNPFFLTEVLAAPEGPVPSTVRDAVLSRASRLPRQAREVLDAAAVVPTRVEIWLLRELAQATEAAIDACVAGGVIRADVPGTLAFRHELARRAVDESLPPAHRTNLHARVTALLLAHYGDDVDSARIAYHAEQAGDASLASDFAAQAARRATQLGAHRQAAEQYDRALRHASGLGDADRAGLLEGFARESRRVDRPVAAYRAAGEAVALRRRLGDARALGRALVLQARTMWTLGRSAAADETVGEAIEILEAGEPGVELAEAYVAVAAFAMLARDHPAAMHWGDHAASLAEDVGSSSTLAFALNVVGASKLVSGEPGGVDDLRRSLAIATEADDDSLMALGWVNLGSGAGEIRDYAISEPALREGIAFTRDHDLDQHLHYLTAWLARVRLERGDWAEAQTLLDQLPLREAGVAVPCEIVALGVEGRLRARRGGADPQPVLDRAWELAGQTGDLQRLWPIAAARAEAAWLAGHARQIPALVEDTFRLGCELDLAWPIGELALWLRRGGGRQPVPDAAAQPWALHASGRLREAAASWEALGCPYEAADALADSEAVEDLRAALDTLDALGAAVPAARVRRRLRELGVRGIPRGPRPATAAHPAGLTPRQSEVLDLLAVGLTDAEIGARLHISPKTVGHHVSAILENLETRSRGEAVHRARELDVLSQNGGTGEPR